MLSKTPGRFIPVVLMSCNIKMIRIRTFESFFEGQQMFFFFFFRNRSHMILVRVRNMAAPAILFHDVISIGLIDWSLSASRTRCCRAPQKLMWTAPLRSFPPERICKCLRDVLFRDKILSNRDSRQETTSRTLFFLNGLYFQWLKY